MKGFNLILLLLFSQINLKEQIDFLKNNPEKSDSIILLWVKARDSVFPFLVDLFKAPQTDIFVKQKIAIALGRMKKKNALSYLYEGLRSSSSILRENCVRAIGEIGDTSGFNHVLSVIDDKNDAVRGAVIYSISKIDLERAKPYLIKFLKDPSFLNRVNAIIFLGKTDDRDMIPHLLSLKNDPNPFVRTAVVKSLGRLGDISLFNVLERFTKDNDPRVRVEALLSMKKISIEKTFPLLENFIDDPEFSMRETVLEILKDVPPELSIPVFYKFLSDPSEKIKQKANKIIEGMKNKEKGFIKILKNDYPLEEKRWAFKKLILYLGEEKAMNTLAKIYVKGKIRKMMEGKYESGMSMEEVYISIGKPSRKRKVKGIEEWDYDNLKITLKFKENILEQIERINLE